MKRLASFILAAIIAAPAGVSRAEDSWPPVQETSLVLQDGSPLDFSAILPNPPIGEGSRLVAGPGGRIVSQSEPDKPRRMLCASLAWSPASGGFPDHATADLYARQLAMHGYNIARLHFVDASLMAGRRTDFDFDPETLDRIDYLLAALKKNGIYWIMDGMSSWRGAYGNYDDRWDPSDNFKLALHLEDGAFAHWKRMQAAFLGRVNPYTGIAPIRDEALAMVVLVNENGIEFDGVVRDRPDKPPYDPMLVAPFNAWLKAKYGSTEALAAAWPDLGAEERIEDGSVQLPTNRYEDVPRFADVQAFFTEIETRSAERMTAALRELGYKGLISTYNNWPTLQTALSREHLDAVTMNTYHDWVGSYSPGATLLQTSSVADGANYMRMAAAARWFGKPFVMTEYDHLFWNRYRYEAGLVMPAYAALQGWDVLCRHAHGPIILEYGEPYPHKKAMLPYAIALDPVARAGETLAALVYRRGDVATASLDIPFAVSGPADLGPDMQAREDDRLTQLALVGRIGLARQDSMAQGPGIGLPRASQDAGALLGQLRETGLLPAENRTNPAEGVAESATGEILLDAVRGQLRVTTARTEAAAFSSLPEPLRLGRLTIEAADGNGLVAVSSIDGDKPIDQARRLLVIFATDAHNSGMRFQDSEDKVIDDFGSLPVLVRPGRLTLSLDRPAGRWSLSPVGLDGLVFASLADGEGPIRFDLDNNLASGPTTFFLLEIDP